MENRNWDATAKLQPLPDSAPQVSATVYWARAVANSRAGRPQAADDDIKRLEECQQKLQSAGSAYWAKQVALLREEALAWQLAARSQTEEALLAMAKAADEEDSVEKLPVTPGPIIPAREQLADMLAGLNRPKEALEAYRAALVEAPDRRGALTGAAKAADLIGDRQTASRMRARMAS